MGSRLGVFVKTRDGWVNRYDHSAAQNLGSALALGGVDVTMPLIWSMSPLGPEVPAAWTLAPWFEGALLVDLTTRTLAWSEETDCEYMPRLVNDLMERTWPGWTAVWAPEGPRGVLAAAGVDADPMYAGVDINLRPFDDSPWLLPWNQPHGDDPLSVRLPTGELVCWGASPVFDFIGELPPEAVRSVASEMLERSKSGSSNLWHDNPPDERPSSGTHVDFRKRLVRWWSMRAEDWAISAYSRYWPGWSSRRWVTTMSGTGRFSVVICTIGSKMSGNSGIGLGGGAPIRRGFSKSKARCPEDLWRWSATKYWFWSGSGSSKSRFHCPRLGLSIVRA